MMIQKGRSVSASTVRSDLVYTISVLSLAMHIQNVLRQNVPRQNVPRQNVTRTKRPKGQTLTVQFFHLLIFPFIYGLSLLLLSLTSTVLSFCTVLSLPPSPFLYFSILFLYCSIPSLLSCPLLCWLVLSFVGLFFPALSPSPFLYFSNLSCTALFLLYCPILTFVGLSFPAHVLSFISFPVLS